jgi:hypothetical protein
MLGGSCESPPSLPDFAKCKMELVSETAKINANPHGLNARELAGYISLGMSSLAAIQTATINDADLLGWSDKIGTIEPGKWADIIAVDADPLKDVSTLQHVKFVMKGGKVVKNEYQQSGWENLRRAGIEYYPGERRQASCRSSSFGVRRPRLVTPISLHVSDVSPPPWRGARDRGCRISCRCTSGECSP